MAKKVFIGVGHGGKDPGAVKYIVEKEYNLKTAFAVAEALSAYGIDFKMSRTQDVDPDMMTKVNNCNNYKPDLVIDIHFNAGGGTGFEVFHSIVGGTSKTLASNIDAEVKKIFSSRGLRTKKGSDGRDYFGIIRMTDAPAVLLEGGFVDTVKDANFIKDNYKKLAQAYADGIAKTLGVKKPTGSTVTSEPANKTQADSSTNQIYRVRKSWTDASSQIGAYKNLSNAKNACQPGYKVFDANGKTVYTNADTDALKVGDKVKVKAKAKEYKGATLASFVYKNIYDVMEIAGDRVVIGLDGKVTAAVAAKNLIKQ